ncbi:MAG: hypothetical protein KDA24_28530 [Deltaproteobacteria bacterium]|nr:hypothetical protein [Deltaproteobacteria bacterium]
MHFPRSLLAAAALAGLLALPGLSHAGSARGVSMEVLVEGRPLAEIASDGRTYVEAKRGRNYSIRLRNDTGGRVAVALAVDGLNSIDAKHTRARDAAKWVLSPYETVEIKGWQVDDSNARRFVFTSEEKSYGSWVGDTRNLGVIQAVFFAERGREVCCVPTPYETYGSDGRADDGDRLSEAESGTLGGLARGEAKSRSAKKPAPSSSPASEESRSPSGAGGSVARDRSTVAPPPRRKKKEERAATGMGGRTPHDVQWTTFDLDPTPLSSFSVRYAYRDELVALGIDPDWGTVTPAIRRRERAAGFAPDPGSACCR